MTGVCNDPCIGLVHLFPRAFETLQKLSGAETEHPGQVIIFIITTGDGQNILDLLLFQKNSSFSADLSAFLSGVFGG